MEEVLSQFDTLYCTSAPVRTETMTRRTRSPDRHSTPGLLLPPTDPTVEVAGMAEESERGIVTLGAQQRGQRLPSFSTLKILGVTISNGLSVLEHVHKVIRSCAQT